ncbi:hypothetical protein QEN19_002423 [Hanseniaspora menglaensis]
MLICISSPKKHTADSTFNSEHMKSLLCNSFHRVRSLVDTPLFKLWVFSVFIKLFLVYGYRSTDFEVHRNWLSITYQLPLKQWYYDTTNIWTLDYPPLFAYFEYILSHITPKPVINDHCLDLMAENVSSEIYGSLTVFWQRITVILSEFGLYLSLRSYSLTDKTSLLVCSSILLNPGFFILDHIHFQYNGFLFGLFISSIIAVKEEKYLKSAFMFSVSLCFKHIYLYLAPCYFVFLLRAYCLNFEHFEFKTYLSLIKIIQWKNLIKLAAVVLSTFFAAFLPFIYIGYGIDDFKQILSRLFPFSRGLTHAYWAPNLWAIYSTLDKFLTILVLYLNKVKYIGAVRQIVDISQLIEQIKLNENENNGSKGLVSDVTFNILPQIPPKITFALTLFYQLLAVLPLFFNCNFNRFIGSLTLCGFSSYLFGWHVHEKAIMLIIIPFTFLVVLDRRLLTPYMLLSSSGIVSLFPLLFTSQDFMIKILYSLIWMILYFVSISEVSEMNYFGQDRRVWFFDRLAMIYIVCLLPIIIISGILDVFKFGNGHYEFLSLMLYSCYCSVGVFTSWIGLSWLYNFDEPLWL